MPHSLPNVSTRSTKGSRTSGRKNSIKSPELNPPNVRRHRTNSQTRAIKTITSTTSSTSTTSTSSTSSSSSSTTSGQQPWNKFKIYLHDGIFRTNPSARSSLVRRIRLVGAKIETCYSVGVTHVITISGEELDEATKLLRGAVMRSGFLRSGSRRSKDLLLKAERRKKRTTPNARRSGAKVDGLEYYEAKNVTPGHNPTVLTARTFLSWLSRREQVMGISTTAPYPLPPSTSTNTNNSRRSGFDRRRSSSISTNNTTNSNNANNANNTNNATLNIQEQQQLLESQSQPVQLVKGISSNQRRKMWKERRITVNGQHPEYDNYVQYKNNLSKNTNNSNVLKRNSNPTNVVTASASSSSSVSSSNEAHLASMVVWDQLTNTQCMCELFPKTRKGKLQIPILHDNAPVGMSPFEKPTTAVCDGAIARERDRALGGSEGVTQKRRNMLAEKVKKPLSGYCENCHEKFSDMKTHIESSKHTQFAEKNNNFKALDNFLEMLSKARNRSQRRTRSPQRKSKPTSTLKLSSSGPIGLTRGSSFEIHHDIQKEIGIDSTNINDGKEIKQKHLKISKMNSNNTKIPTMKNSDKHTTSSSNHLKHSNEASRRSHSKKRKHIEGTSSNLGRSNLGRNRYGTTGCMGSGFFSNDNLMSRRGNFASGFMSNEPTPAPSNAGSRLLINEEDEEMNEMEDEDVIQRDPEGFMLIEMDEEELMEESEHGSELERLEMEEAPRMSPSIPAVRGRRRRAAARQGRIPKPPTSTTSSTSSTSSTYVNKPPRPPSVKTQGASKSRKMAVRSKTPTTRKSGSNTRVKSVGGSSVARRASTRTSGRTKRIASSGNKTTKENAVNGLIKIKNPKKRTNDGIKGCGLSGLQPAFVSNKKRRKGTKKESSSSANASKKIEFQVE